jgi:hypothetical protein
MRAYQLPKGGAGIEALVKIERPNPKRDKAGDRQGVRLRRNSSGHFSSARHTTHRRTPVRIGLIERLSIVGNEGRPAPQKSLYDSLEQEMASLLGRSGSKTLVEGGYANDCIRR